MLLGSPPDMIRGYPLRETGSAAGGGGVVIGISYHIFSRLATGNLTVGKESPKRRLRRKKQGDFEEVPRLADATAAESRLA